MRRRPTRPRTASSWRALALAAVLHGPLAAHGGQYLGPTIGGAPPAPSVPGAGPGTPVLVPGGPTTGGQADLDVSSWRVWWELNQGRYVDRPTRTGVDDATRARVAAAFAALLGRTEDPDVCTASLVALGKTGLADAALRDVVRASLARSHIEVREAAVLALGLAGDPAAVADLDALVRGTADGRRLLRTDDVPDRVRTFAAYAAGVLAQRCDDAAVQAAVLASLGAVLEDGRTKDRDVLTGVLNAIRMIRPEPARGAAHKRLLWTAVATLDAFLDKRFRDERAAVQAHALTALAMLVGRGDGVEQDRARARILELLERPATEKEIHVAATIALGKVLRPGDDDALELLRRRIARPTDPLVERFGMITLGEVGGRAAYEQLRRAFTGNDRGVQAWAALGLGLLAAGDRGAPADDPQQASATGLRGEVGALLEDGLRKNRNRDVLAAIAIGLGLAGHEPAAPALREILGERMNLEEQSGPTAIGLALLGDRGAIPAIREGMSRVDRPVLFGHAALALAHLDVADASSVAVAALVSGGGNTPWRIPRLAAAANAIGRLGNPNDVPALLDALGGIDGRGRASRDTLTVAFAAAALGAIADRDPLGFGTRVAEGMDYAARAPTISNGSSGILDIF